MIKNKKQKGFRIIGVLLSIMLTSTSCFLDSYQKVVVEARNPDGSSSDVREFFELLSEKRYITRYDELTEGRNESDESEIKEFLKELFDDMKKETEVVNSFKINFVDYGFDKLLKEIFEGLKSGRPEEEIEKNLFLIAKNRENEYKVEVTDRDDGTKKQTIDYLKKGSSDIASTIAKNLGVDPSQVFIFLDNDLLNGRLDLFRDILNRADKNSRLSYKVLPKELTVNCAVENFTEALTYRVSIETLRSKGLDSLKAEILKRFNLNIDSFNLLDFKGVEANKHMSPRIFLENLILKNTDCEGNLNLELFAKEAFSRIQTGVFTPENVKENEINILLNKNLLDKTYYFVKDTIFQRVTRYEFCPSDYYKLVTSDGKEIEDTADTFKECLKNSGIEDFDNLHLKIMRKVEKGKEREEIKKDFAKLPESFEHYLCAAAVVKNEGPYLREWIEYHTELGVEVFYIYDNDSTDNTEAILKPYIDSGRVVYKKFPGKGIQLSAIREQIDAARNKTYWLAILDLDEFICMKNEESLIDFLHGFEGRAGVAAVWNTYEAAGINETDGLVVEKSSKYKIGDSCAYPFKSIVNPRIVERAGVHICTFYSEMSVDENRKRLSPHNPVSNRIAINHYQTKSLEKFLQKNVRKDVCYTSDDAPLTFPLTKFDELNDGDEEGRIPQDTKFLERIKSRMKDKRFNTVHDGEVFNCCFKLPTGIALMSEEQRKNIQMWMFDAMASNEWDWLVKEKFLTMPESEQLEYIKLLESKIDYDYKNPVQPMGFYLPDDEDIELKIQGLKAQMKKDMLET